MAVLVFYAGYKWGPGLTYDSINYLYAGYSLHEKGKLLRPFNTPYIEWPPLYPVLIAALNYLPGTLLQSVYFFQIMIAAITVGLAGKLVQHTVGNRLLQIVACLSIAFSTPLLLVNHFVWSESFFVLLVVVQIHLFIRYTCQPDKYWWILLVINGMLLCLQRQVGILFVAGGACLLLMYPKMYSFQKKCISSTLYGLLSLIPLLWWWKRNYQLKGLLMNDYRDTVWLTPLPEHWSVYQDIFTSWFLPDEMVVWIRIALVYGGIMVLSVAYVRMMKSDLLQQESILIMTILFLSYFILLFVVSFIVAEPIDDRKLAPVYIPGMLLIFRLLDVCISHWPIKKKHWIMYVCLLWAIYPISRGLYNAYVWHNILKQAGSEQPVEEAFLEKIAF